MKYKGVGKLEAVFIMHDRFKSYISNFDLKKNKENRKIIFAVISTAEYSKFAKYRINN